MMQRRALFAFPLLAALVACAPDTLRDLPVQASSGPSGGAQVAEWRALVAAGDDSISVFDNAVDK